MKKYFHFLKQFTIPEHLTEQDGITARTFEKPGLAVKNELTKENNF